MIDEVTYETRDGIALIGLNRPQKKNALTVAMYAALVDALEQAERDPAVRVLLLHGSDACFTAGNDLQDFLNAGLGGGSGSDASPTVRFLHGISRLAKPLVAAVAGPAVGIGTTVLLHSDLVFADPGARFQLPFVNLGLCPEAASSLLLPQIVGYRRAAELLLLGEPFTAPAALEMGLVNALSAPGAVIAHALDVAQRLARQPPESVRITKSLLKQPTAALVASTINAELELFRERLQSPEAKEALRAFFEKRPPDFSRFT